MLWLSCILDSGPDQLNFTFISQAARTKKNEQAMEKCFYCTCVYVIASAFTKNMRRPDLYSCRSD